MTTADLTHYAYAQLDRVLRAAGVDVSDAPPRQRNLPAANSNGEIPGLPHPWACCLYGAPTHDYHECSTCHANYQRWLRRRGVAV